MLFENIEKFLRTPILKNICERRLLRFSLELFSIWTNNIGSKEDVFSKIKQNKNRSKTQLHRKNLPFHDVLYQFVFLFFSTSRQTAFALDDKKNQFWNSLTNEQLILDQWKYYSLILSILYLLLGSRRWEMLYNHLCCNNKY